MTDQAVQWTDKQIEELERRIRGVYTEAAGDIQRKLDKFIAKFRRDDKKYRAQLEAGEITQETYHDWLAGQVFQGKRWRQMLANLTETLTHSNELAMQIINDTTPEAFAYNANWSSYTLEKGARINMGFELYDASTVKQLIRDQPDLLPPSRVDIPADKRWNHTQITQQITQGIIQGEPLETVVKRLQRVTTANEISARRHARTAMTYAQNAGRIESYHQAAKLGIKLQKEWRATLDNHTRHSHAMLDGQRVDVDKPFQSELGEIMCPGDPNARPTNVYNCRCTLVSYNPKYPPRNETRIDNITRDTIPFKTYAEWAGWKETHNGGEPDRQQRGVFGRAGTRKGAGT